jgi:hypothetical protein
LNRTYVVYVVTWHVFWGCQFPVVLRHVTNHEKSWHVANMAAYKAAATCGRHVGNINNINKTTLHVAAEISTQPRQCTPGSMCNSWCLREDTLSPFLWCHLVAHQCPLILWRLSIW